jgi:hypothetical protein
MLHARRIYRDEYDLLHEGMQRLAAAKEWQVIERPTEPNPDEPPDPRLVTLEILGLGRLRPVPEAPETMACETCVNRHNPPGSGPCVNCDLTLDGPDSNYSAEAAEPVNLRRDLDEDDEDDDDDDDGET